MDEQVPGVEEQPVAEVAEDLTQSQAAQASESTHEVDPKAFAARLRQAQEQWERDNARYIQTAKRLEQYGYDLDTVLRNMETQTLEDLMARGMDERLAREYLETKQRADAMQAEREAAQLTMDGMRLAKVYPDYDHDAVLAYAQQQADATGSSLTLEQAYLLMHAEQQRRVGEQSVLRQMQAGKSKTVEFPGGGPARNSIDQMDPNSPEFESLLAKVKAGEKIDL